MKKIISLVLAVLMLTCVFASCGAKKGQTLEDIKKSGELVVYTEAGFAPFEFVYNNEVVGVDMAICEEIAKEIGVKPSKCIFVGDSDVDMKTAPILKY